MNAVVISLSVACSLLVVALFSVLILALREIRLQREQMMERIEKLQEVLAARTLSEWAHAQKIAATAKAIENGAPPSSPKPNPYTSYLAQAEE